MVFIVERQIWELLNPQVWFEKIDQCQHSFTWKRQYVLLYKKIKCLIKTIIEKSLRIQERNRFNRIHRIKIIHLKLEEEEGKVFLDLKTGFDRVNREKLW